MRIHKDITGAKACDQSHHPIYTGSLIEDGGTGSVARERAVLIKEYCRTDHTINVSGHSLYVLLELI
jgi:hypothetical protein